MSKRLGRNRKRKLELKLASLERELEVADSRANQLLEERAGVERLVEILSHRCGNSLYLPKTEIDLLRQQLGNFRIPISDGVFDSPSWTGRPLKIDFRAIDLHVFEAAISKHKLDEVIHFRMNLTPSIEGFHGCAYSFSKEALTFDPKRVIENAMIDIEKFIFSEVKRMNLSEDF